MSLTKHLTTNTLKKSGIRWTLALASILGVIGVMTTPEQSQAQLNTQVNLVISGWTVTIGSTWSFTVGTLTVSSSQQLIANQFTGANSEFFVEDLKGANSGYYTTLQSSWLTSVNGTIPAANIAARTSTLATVLLTGTANTGVVMWSWFTSYQAIGTPITFIKRDPAPNAGRIGRYGAYPFIQVTVPAYQPVGTYTGTLTYTLIEN